MDYRIERATTLEDLVKRVNALAADGWEPLGGVAVAESPSKGVERFYGNNSLYLQAMVKRGTPE